MSAKGRRHPVSVMRRAQELREAGWSSNKIVALLADEGVSCSRQSVMRWVDPDYADRVRQQVTAANRKRHAPGWTFRMPGAAASPEYRKAFMRRLREAGVPPASIAKVCGVVFDQPVSREVVERIVRDRSAA